VTQPAHYNSRVASQRGFIGLGSNLGERRAQIVRAIQLMQATPGLDVNAVSNVYETPSWGYQSEHKYLNAVAQVTWDSTPQNLLSTCRCIEAVLGRKRSEEAQANGYTDRVIDLDILWLDGVAVSDCDLTLPHPRAHHRAFALKPWLELAPELELHGRSLGEWLEELPQEDVENVELAGTLI